MKYHHTRGFSMPKAKIAISLDEKTLRKLDRLVDEEVFPNRSQAIEAAITEKLERLDHGRLSRLHVEEALDHKARRIGEADAKGARTNRGRRPQIDVVAKVREELVAVDGRLAAVEGEKDPRVGAT